ncbi:amidohydrolase family protein [Candidatus Poribacteria bacterium]|nr:amidohydrolase family protein [Candidatus Poribacteria bacterium]
MIDINTYTGSWPYRPLKYSRLTDLQQMLNSHGIQKALVSPIEGMFYDDPQLANEELYKAIKKSHQLLPVAVIDPSMTNWSQSMEKCFIEMKFIALKLHPNYHGYSLSHDSVYQMLELAGQTNKPVIIQMRIQDIRAQSDLARAEDVSIQQVIGVVRDHPNTGFILGGIKWVEAAVSSQDIKELENLWLDISNLEYMGGLRRMIQLYGPQKLVFGTHAPFFVVRSAILKLQAAGLSEEERKNITIGNAQTVLKNMLIQV